MMMTVIAIDNDDDDGHDDDDDDVQTMVTALRKSRGLLELIICLIGGYF